jgi:hypothetical protein
MSYEKQKKGVRNDILAWVEVIVCQECGAEIFDTDKHDAFHKRLSRTTKDARSAAGMLRPLG